MQEWYYGWNWRPKRLTNEQKRKMIKNMRKSTLIVKKSDEYHKKEEAEADDILKKIA